MKFEKPRRSTRRMAWVAAAACVLPLACGGPAAQPAQSVADDLVTKAKADGSVVVYGSSSQQALQADADAFQKQYGITVTFTRLVTGPLTVRLNQELAAGAPKADVIITSDTASLAGWSDKGVFQKLPPAKYPTPSPYYAPIQIIGQGLIYNTNIVKKSEVPKTFKDLLDLKWKGKIALGNPRIGPAYVTLYYALLQDPKYGTQYFQDLAKQSPRVIESDVLLASSVAAGEAAIGFTGYQYLASNIQATQPKAPIAFTYLDDSAELATDVAVVSKPAHPAAAQLLARWLLSAEGQRAHDGQGRASAPLGDIGGGVALLPPKDRVKTYPDTTVAAGRDAIIKLFDSTYK